LEKKEPNSTLKTLEDGGKELALKAKGGNLIHTAVPKRANSLGRGTSYMSFRGNGPMGEHHSSMEGSALHQKNVWEDYN